MHQPENPFCFCDLYEEPKETSRTINDHEQVALVTLEEAIEPLVDLVSHVKEMVKLVKEMIKSIKEKCLQPKDNLSIDESASIMFYTMEWTPIENSFYYIFNRTLSSNDQNQLKPWYLYMKLFSTALSKLPPSTRRIFYRKIPLNLQIPYSENTRFFWHGYSACCSSVEFFNQKTIPLDPMSHRTLFIIHSEHAIDISEHSWYPLKHIFLLPPGQQFQVVSCRISTDDLCMIMLKEIPTESIAKTVINEEEKQVFARAFEKRMIKWEKKSEINLRNQRLTDSHMDTIVKFAIQKKKCQWLSLQNNRITSHGLAILAKGLKGNDYLQSLHLSQNLLGDFGVGCLGKILEDKYTNLTLISLCYNRIRDAGVRYLAEMLKRNKILTDLWLSNNEIGNDGVQALAEVLTFDNTTLIQLYLHGNRFITDWSVYSLVRLLQSNRKLNTLWLQDCSLTSAGQDKLTNIPKSSKDFDLYV